MNDINGLITVQRVLELIDKMSGINRDLADRYKEPAAAAHLRGAELVCASLKTEILMEDRRRIGMRRLTATEERAALAWHSHGLISIDEIPDADIRKTVQELAERLYGKRSSDEKLS